MALKPVVLALDLGGTNLRWALVDRQGDILAKWEKATASLPEQETLIEGLAELMQEAAAAARNRGAEVQAASFGVPGRVLPEEGLVAFSPNVPALNDCPLLPSLRPRLPWPLSLENDANLFTLGEHWLGAGRGYNHVLGITLGTGVGGGLILNGALWQGTAGTSGEVGHLTVEPDGEKCKCGNRGCLETVASAPWVTAWVKKELGRGASSWLKELWLADPDAIIGETLVTAARMLDPLALKAFERAGRYLAIAIADVVHLLGLSRVVIGGRFARAWDHFYRPLQEELYRRLTLFPPERVSVAPARLDDHAGILGAARLAWDKLPS
jgi:glucokinase|uniref:ROK family protein n=1 Tax=Desulfobacca acetoxidans TaxID=60893 RepID=A0A7C3V728_9BACT